MPTPTCILAGFSACSANAFALAATCRDRGCAAAAARHARARGWLRPWRRSARGGAPARRWTRARDRSLEEGDRPSSSRATRRRSISLSPFASARWTAGTLTRSSRPAPGSLWRSSRAASCSSTAAIRYGSSHCPVEVGGRPFGVVQRYKGACLNQDGKRRAARRVSHR
jgi:hypothetical protein